MKKISIFLFTILAVLVVSVRPAGAVSLLDRLQNREEKMDQVQEQQQERQEENQDQREEVQADRQQQRNEVAQKHAVRLQARFEKYSDRLTALMAKIQSRITLMAGNGKEVTSAQEKLDQAKTKLTEAQELGTKAIEGFKAINPETYGQQRGLALEARDFANQAKKAFQETLNLLIQSVQLLQLAKS